MLKLLLKTFYYDNINYVVDNPKEKVIEILDILFTEKKGLFKSPNLIGKFIEYPNSFSLEPKWSLAVIRNFERSAAYLKGTISETENGKTKIKISVRPNSVFGILFLLFVPIGVYNIYNYSTKTGTQNNLYGGLFIIIIGLPMLFGLAKAMVHGLKENFENYLNAYRVDRK